MLIYPILSWSIKTLSIQLTHSNSQHTGENVKLFCNFRVGRDFLSIAQKAENINKMINALGYIKSAHFCIVKDTINKLKRQAIDWERTFAMHIMK